MADGVLDTTVFVDYYRGHSGARELVDGFLRSGRMPAYSPIPVFELWVMPMGAPEALQHTALLSLFEEAQLGESAARLAADWLRGRTRMARLRLIGDALIAATAADRGDIIYTRNVRDFRRFNANVQSY